MSGKEIKVEVDSAKSEQAKNNIHYLVIPRVVRFRLVHSLYSSFMDGSMKANFIIPMEYTLRTESVKNRSRVFIASKAWKIFLLLHGFLSQSRTETSVLVL